MCRIGIFCAYFRNLLVQNFQSMLKLWCISIFKIKFLPIYRLDFVLENPHRSFTLVEEDINAFFCFDWFCRVSKFQSLHGVVVFLFQPKNDIILIMLTDDYFLQGPQSVAVNLRTIFLETGDVVHWFIIVKGNRNLLMRKFSRLSIFKLNFLRILQVWSLPQCSKSKEITPIKETFHCKITFWLFELKS